MSARRHFRSSAKRAPFRHSERSLRSEESLFSWVSVEEGFLASLGMTYQPAEKLVLKYLTNTATRRSHDDHHFQRELSEGYRRGGGGRQDGDPRAAGPLA